MTRPGDKRQSCYWCRHRYSDHSPSGRCLGWVDDPDATSLYQCGCARWESKRMALGRLEKEKGA